MLSECWPAMWSIGRFAAARSVFPSMFTFAYVLCLGQVMGEDHILFVGGWVARGKTVLPEFCIQCVRV